MTASGLNYSGDGACDSYALGRIPENQALTTVIGYTGSVSTRVGVSQKVAKKVSISS